MAHPEEEGRVPRGRAIITYPQYIDECAIYLGKLRDLYTAKIKQKDPIHQRDKDKNTENVNITGARGELVFFHHLFIHGIEHETPLLLSSGPISSYDVKVEGIAVDVKTIRHDGSDLLVREDQHQRAKAKIYAFLKVVPGQKAYIWTFRYDDVSKWAIQPYKHNNCYCLPIEYIVPSSDNPKQGE